MPKTSCNETSKVLKTKLIFILSIISLFSWGQNYTSYYTGNANIVTNPSGGVCLMGGASEDDNAMKWFLQRANGGDVLVLRTSGSNGYNSYLYSELGIPVNSVETIVCNNVLASNEPYIIQKIQEAEAIWFAGGDQWTYISYWRNSPIDNAINQAIQQRNTVVGGTSAGMVIQGEYYFSAQNGTVTSATALSNPYNGLVTVDSSAFIQNNFLDNTMTDTHFDNPDRKGRLITFLARISSDYGVFGKAIACDEYTAVCIDTNGIARVFGGYPSYDDNVYFIQSNCELANQTPENCTSGNPLTWDLGGLAVKTYQIKGDATGSKTFDLTNWQSGTGGTWKNWFVSNGVFSEQPGTPVNCSSLSIDTISEDSTIWIYPNPTKDNLRITTNEMLINSTAIGLYNNVGQKFTIATLQIGNEYHVDLSALKNGIYFLILEGVDGKQHFSKIIKD